MTDAVGADFPDEANCLQLIRAVTSEQHEEWMEDIRHPKDELLREQIKPMKSMMMTA